MGLKVKSAKSPTRIGHNAGVIQNSGPSFLNQMQYTSRMGSVFLSFFLSLVLKRKPISFLRSFFPLISLFPPVFCTHSRTYKFDAHCSPLIWFIWIVLSETPSCFLGVVCSSFWSWDRIFDFEGTLCDCNLWVDIYSFRQSGAMGRLFSITLEGNFYSCRHCRTHFALSEDIISEVPPLSISLCSYICTYVYEPILESLC